jgi:hypothetical protein
VCRIIVDEAGNVTLLLLLLLFFFVLVFHARKK